MATIKLGMLVTQIAGSIGGTTFRRSGSVIVMQNKSKGGSKNVLLLNKQLPRLKTFIQAWSSLSSVLRNSWNAQALNFEFVDKFGDLKNLTGRQLFIKQANHCYNVGLPIPEPATLSSIVADTTANSFDLQIYSTAKLSFPSLYADTYFTVQVEILKNTAIHPTFINRIILFGGVQGLYKELDFGTSFWARYSYLKEGQLVRAYYTSYNSSGFKSITKTFIGTVN